MVHSAPAHRKSWLWVVVLAMMILPGIVSLLYLRSAPHKPIDSLAVLPFTYSSDDSEAGQLSERITGHLIWRLSQLPSLKVAPLETILPYKGETKSPQTVGHELGVRAIVQGRIERQDDNFYITAELFDSGDNGVLWSRRYQLTGDEDVAAFQEEIARHLADYARSR